jgi:hypothetical protein
MGAESPTPTLLEHMTQVREYLYIGNENDAKNKAALKEANIGYVLNITKDIPNFFQSDSPSDDYSIIYKRIAVSSVLISVFFCLISFVVVPVLSVYRVSLARSTRPWRRLVIQHVCT